MRTKVEAAQMGLDAHRAFSRVTARDAQGQVVWRQRLDHQDRQSLREELQRWPQGTPVVLEGTFGWGWLTDELQRAGLAPHLASSRKVAAWRQARGLAKSNRTDADLLSELWSQQPRWWEVWLAPPEVRDRREWMRYRMTLVAMQTRLKNQIHAILHRHGIVHPYADLFGRDGRQLLNLLTAPKDGTLRDSARAMLKGYLRLLDQVRGQIARLTRELRKQLVQDPLGERLCSVPGIGWVLAYTMVAEIGRIERFPSAKHLASYSLLAPRADDSGEEDPEAPAQGRHVGLIGRRTLKWAFIEAAHSAVRHGGRFREIYDRRTNGGKRDRNRGRIAVAHELCRLVYVIWSKGIEYTETPPPRPGRRYRKGRGSRPGRGQPDHPMVVAV
jgi:transposase